MLTRNIVLTLCALLCASLFLGCDDQKAPLVSAKNGFEIKLLSGESFDIRIEPSEARYNTLVLDQRGKKPVLFAFFTTICPECAKEIPHLIDLKERYGESVDLLGVLVENRSAEEVADFVAFHQINYPVIVGAGAFRLADAVGGVRLIPAIHIYDDSGAYVTHFVGPVPQEMLETRLNSLIKAN
ncbi:hypothetical protein AGMMS49521_4410 [Campylobacterota bacterium]|nr:hypothetical protein AGMMS49521_4410 [Campylobacterota bacterium]GHV04124.1 hypothetical protein AGMMS50229_04780 [Campylobacterota bacterium]